MKEGVTSMAFATFTEWKSVIVVLLPAINMICPGSSMEETIAAFLAQWMALRRGEKQPHTNGSLAHLNSQCQEMKRLFTSHFKQFSPSKLNFHKFHDVGHAAERIAEFGPVACTSAQLEGLAHQQNTKSA